MAFDKTITNYIAGWSEDATNVTFPIASIPQLTAAEADAATGDIRKVLFALLDQIYATWTALPTGDRSTKMTVSRTQSMYAGKIGTTYRFDFQLDPLAVEVTDE